MKVTTLHELFVDELRGALDVEQQLTEVLPELAKQAQDSDLKKTLHEHLKETKDQAKRLEDILEELGEDATPRACTAMREILAEGSKMIENADPAVRDVVLTAAAGKVEHYESAMYMGLHELATTMDHSDAAKLLKESLGEEMETAKAGAAAMKRIAADAPSGMEE